MLRMIAMLAALSLAACGSSGGARPRTGVPGYAGGDISCVPYARARSGIDLQGDAWEWWEAAASTSRYDRSRRPRAGSVLVFMRTYRNRTGHLSVVTRVVSSREIRVDHANWASGRNRGRIARDQPVVDVSPNNDWSLVRVWYPPVNDLGQSTYPTFGFIHGGTLVAEAR
ncbi:CHAP domain-containing protein [Neoroseomonas soli]|uniref:CHAP domain-containing protein n=1 Tax=Neoroseomonas soli TaxID=1081025 RepID=A0A9X9WVQ8_9PROT|nr:CHAP domain-containing protein [Neoroseomonas soli]MBR0671237.1 CHAP domain-containing protein [Neoroseomonas soli]